ncbi:MAG: hypothetical protein PHE24_01820 [Patescibacteria group bacterium]|nr:hypothetical protein [Patescibacteria group bacterium]
MASPVWGESNRWITSLRVIVCDLKDPFNGLDALLKELERHASSLLLVMIDYTRPNSVQASSTNLFSSAQ